MKHAPLLITLLVVATLLVNVVAWGVLIDDPKRFSWETAVGYSLPLAQVGLMSMWLGLGRRYFVVRIVSSAVAIAGWSIFLTRLPGNYPWAVPLITTCAVITMVILILRAFRYAIVDVDRTECNSPPADFQFSIAQMLVLTTTIAVSLGILKATGIQEVRTRELIEGLAIGALLGPVVIPSLWLALGTGRPLRRLLLPPACQLLTAFAFGAYIGDMADPTVYWLSGLIAAQSIVSLLVIRQCGYRFVRVGRGGGGESGGEPLNDAIQET